MLADEENVSGPEAENETEEVADAGAWEEFGIAVTHGFSTSIQGNLPSPIEEASIDDNEQTIDADVEAAEALDNVLEVENTLETVIAKRDMEYGADYKGVRNQAFLSGQRFQGLRPKLQNIPALSRGVAESLTMFRFCAGKQPGGSWNLHFPRTDGKPGIARTLPACKNEAAFWDCVAQQVCIG
jgi:hypothetical protein